jgi:hypothetical protein
MKSVKLSHALLLLCMAGSATAQGPAAYPDESPLTPEQERQIVEAGRVAGREPMATQAERAAHD